jgi:hypothetical protein
MIQNKGELPIWGLRLMGLSEKASDKIGRFGTGLKESLALLARLGLQPIIFSGELRIDIEVKLWDSQEELSFMLSEARSRFQAGIWYGLGIHPNLGKHDWDDPWMIFREVICNALDESGTDDLFHDICYHEPEGKAGATRFYIPATEAIVAAYGTIESKLLPLGQFTTEIEVGGTGRIIQKREASKLQVFHRGVWIQEHESNSLFDYEIDSLKLNESRSADWYDVNNEIGHMVAHYSQEQAQVLLHEVVQRSRSALYEIDVLQRAGYCHTLNKEGWRNAFMTLFGENAVLTDDTRYLYEKLRALGKEPVVVTHSGLRYLLKAADVPTVDKVLTREQRKWKDIIKAPQTTQEVFDRVWGRLHFHGLTYGAEKPKLSMFTEHPGGTGITFGAYAEGTVYINTTIAGSEKERQACIEEIAHHVSEHGDETRQFQTFLLEIADHFMFMKKKEKVPPAEPDKKDREPWT